MPSLSGFLKRGLVGPQVVRSCRQARRPAIDADAL